MNEYQRPKQELMLKALGNSVARAIPDISVSSLPPFPNKEDVSVTTESKLASLAMLSTEDLGWRCHGVKTQPTLRGEIANLLI